MCLPVPCPVLWPVHGTASIYQNLSSDFGIGAPEGCVPPSLTGRLADHCEVAGPPYAASGSCSPVVQGPGHCGQLGEVGPPPVHLCSVSGHVDRHVSREGVSVRGSPSWIQEVVTSSLALPLPPACMWRWLMGHKASLKRFLPRGRSCMRPLQWHLKDDPSFQVPLSPE